MRCPGKNDNDRNYIALFHKVLKLTWQAPSLQTTLSPQSRDFGASPASQRGPSLDRGPRWWKPGTGGGSDQQTLTTNKIDL